MVIGARRRADEVNETLDAVAACAPPGGSLEQRLLLSLGGGLKRAGGRLDAAAEAGSPGERLIRRLLNEALQKAADRDAPETERGVAARMLACYPFGQTRTVLASLLDPAEPQSVRLSAVRALADQSEDEVADVLLERWNQLAPAVAEAVLEALLARETWSLEYLRAVERGGASLAQLDSAQRGRLLDHRNAAVRDLAGRLFAGVQPADRKQVIADYQAALASPGDRQRGLAVFQKHCQSCHKIGESGFGGGPDLTNSPGREPAALLSHILDPNSNVAPNYVQYVVIDRQGRTYAGLITSETATSVTLRSAKEVEETILRSQIEEIASTGKSFMPEGFEHEISPPEMADLLAYLQSLQAPAPLDVGTEGAMVEPQTRAGGR